MILKRLFFVGLLVTLAINAYAKDCIKTGSVCTDSTPSKVISGVTVTLAQVGGCWEYTDTYQCLKPNSVNYCQPFVNAQPQCWQTTSQCSETDTLINGSCMKYSQTWRCSDPNFPTPTNTTVLDDTYTLVSSNYNSSQCDAIAAQSGCSIAEDRCVQTTPSSPLPPGITSAQVAPDGCYAREKKYACYATPSAQTTSCIRSRSTCIDTTPSKVINGVTVTLAQAGGCWQYRDDCLSSSSINYCSPLESNSQCRNTATTCIQSDSTFGTGCMKYSATWRCNDPSTSTPPNTIRLDNSYTLVSSNYDQTPCQSLSTAPNCSLASSTCVQTTPDSPLPPGISSTQVAPDGCYKTKNDYACTGTVDGSQCNALASNPACTLKTSTCTDSLNNQCTFEERTYSCLSKPAKTESVTDCSGQNYCADGNCFASGNPPDSDFAKAAVMMESMREAATYMDAGALKVFSGKDNRCTKKLFGLVNCCKSSSGGDLYNNGALFGLALDAGGQVLKYGSSYVYDALYTSEAPNWIVNGVGALVGVDPVKVSSAVDALSPATLSLYGFSVSTGALTEGAALIGEFGGISLGFNPTSFAIQIGLMVLSDLMSCSQEEGLLGMKRGQNLCHSLGSYCSSKLNLLVGKICIERTESYCCYNSRLARIINEQGRPQLSMGWGSAESPSCSGFTPEQLQALDFSKMNLSEFISEISPSMPNASAVAQSNKNLVNQKVQNYYGGNP